MMAAAVVVGGAGALGRAIVRALSLRRQKASAAARLSPIVSVDFRPLELGEEGEEGAHSIVLPSSPSSGEWHEVGEWVAAELRALGFDYGSVFHAAGGWAGACRARACMCARVCVCLGGAARTIGSGRSVSCAYTRRST